MRTDRAKEESIRNDLELETISVALPRLLVERLKVLGFSLERSPSSIIKQSLEGFLDCLGDTENGERASDLGSALRQAGRKRLMQQHAAWSDD